jgi:hypothetical protein
MVYESPESVEFYDCYQAPRRAFSAPGFRCLL